MSTTVHLCALCGGEIEHETGDSELSRCTRCGAEEEGPPDMLCACGMRTKGGRIPGFRCRTVEDDNGELTPAFVFESSYS